MVNAMEKHGKIYHVNTQGFQHLPFPHGWFEWLFYQHKIAVWFRAFHNTDIYWNGLRLFFPNVINNYLHRDGDFMVIFHRFWNVACTKKMSCFNSCVDAKTIISLWRLINVNHVDPLPAGTSWSQLISVDLSWVSKLGTPIKLWMVFLLNYTNII